MNQEENHETGRGLSHIQEPILPHQREREEEEGFVERRGAVFQTDHNNIEDHQSGHFADESINDDDVNSPREEEQGLLYWGSSQFRELVACTIFMVLSLIFFHLVLVTPRRRPIPFQKLQDSGDYVRNLTHDETFDGDTVPDLLLPVISFLLPLSIQLVLRSRWAPEDAAGSGDRSCSSWFYKAHATLCVYMVAATITSIATNTVKVYVGYLRPDFYQECQPNEDYSECTEEKHHGDLRKSFPSGHSSLSFCTFTLLTLYIHNQFGMGANSKKRQQHLLQQPHLQPVWRREDCRPRIISILSLLPLGLALFVATSRIVDNKHFPADVVAGAVVGASISNFVYRLWFW